MKLPLLFILLSTACHAESQQEFCAGFRQGLRSGWCEGHPAWAKCQPEPLPCPTRSGTFQDGYDAGYSVGLEKHQCGHAPCGGEK